MTDYGRVWRIDEAEFPYRGTDADRLRFVLRYAILAPSGHNGQPWRFDIHGDVLSVRADRTRALPTIDPDDRELLIACAATIHLVRVALRHFGHQPQVTVLPDPSDPDLLATVRPGEPSAAVATDGLFQAVTQRHCNRHPYQPRPIPRAELDRLRQAAADEGAWLEVIANPSTIAAAADLIAEGDRVKWCDPVFRDELAHRLIPNRGRRRDGMPGYAFGAPGPLARLAPTVVRHIDLGRMRAASDRKLALATPALAVVGTDRDEPAAWLAAGQAMSHVLLRATADGLATSFLSQAIEVPELRPRLAALLDRPGHPQLLLRIGYARGRAHVAPRRPLEDVLDDRTTGAGIAAAIVREGARR
jgi:nitroreductase